MGKKSPATVETWRTAGALNTPSQINKFFDTCTDWILATPVGRHASVVESVCREASLDTSVLLGVTDEDAVLIPHRSCYLCRTPTRDYQVANPFCRAYGVSMCNSCYASSI